MVRYTPTYAELHSIQKLWNEYHPRAGQSRGGAFLGQQGYEFHSPGSGPYRRRLPRYPSWYDTCRWKCPVSFRTGSTIDC